MKRLVHITGEPDDGLMTAVSFHSPPSAIRFPPSTVSSSRGFTLVEIMVAILLVLMASTMTYVTFAAVTKAWRNGSRMAEDLNHGDFIMDQLVMGLRSAYFPDAQGQVATYGFWLTDSGSGSSSDDAISWVKQGTALTESNSVTVAGPHRVRFSIEKNEDGVPSAAVRYWRPFALPDDFDPMAIQPEFISSRVCGFNCRVATNTSENIWEWSDIWEKDDTNRLPRAVELTIYLEPIGKDRAPVEITRCVEIPVWRLSWGGGGPAAGQFRNPVTAIGHVHNNTPLQIKKK
ncbi:MAG: prepilin-type N-terminal cleavage/methylation domain-containing protein [bacterium]